ncbi:FAD-dependent oxidoreductase, partial [Achromobacter insolitus]
MQASSSQDPASATGNPATSASNRVALPAAVDVAIVGGGIIGISTAYSLACAGLRVAVFEKGTLACEQSSRNWGWVRTLGRDLPEVPLAQRANQLWGEIQDKIDVGFRRNGMFYLQENDSDAAGHQAWIDGARQYGVDARLLDNRKLRKMLPATGRSWTGAMYSPTDGVAEPQLATRAIATLARAAGAQVFEGCAVRGVERSAGRV